MNQTSDIQTLESPTVSAPDDQEYERNATRAFAGQEPEQPMSALGTDFLAEFSRAELDRRPTEQRWLSDLRQYRGRYEPDEETKIGKHRSRSFVRKTRVKVKTVDSRVSDLLFPSGNDKNWNIDPTPVPDVSDQERQTVMQQLLAQKVQQAQQMQPQGQPQAAPGGDPAQAQPPMQQLTIVPPTEQEVDDAIMEQCKVAAREMSKEMDDQLVEARYKKQALQVLHSGHLYGTGILKGPLVERCVRTRFSKKPSLDEQGNPTGGMDWKPYSESYVIPFVDAVPIWRFYPDMSATTIAECQFVFERHNFTHAKLYALASRASFNKRAIVEHLTANPSGLMTLRNYDSDLKAIGERESKQNDHTGQYEVLERWGWVTGIKLKQAGVEVEEDREQESFFCNVWMFPNGTVIKAVIQPIDGTTWPYHLYYFDKDETSIFGEGLSAIMRDDQKMINAITRMILDNAAITSGPMLEVVAELLASGEDPTDIYPWKVFLRKKADIAAGPAVRSIVLPNNLEDLERIVNQFDKNADEVTAIPRYVTGENATSGAAGTSSGLSMLMGAVNIVIKDLITGYDEGITVPFLQALYHWNMKFNPRPDIKGDFDVYARGNASLVAKEVRARQLNDFAQLTLNPEDGKYIKRHKLMQQRAEALEMSDVVKTEDEVKSDDESEAAQQAAKMQQDMAAAQLAEQQAKAGKLMAEAEVAKTKVTEMLKKLEVMAAGMLKTQAEVEHLQADTITKKVEAIFAALQAGGVATSRPAIAPAGDEILRSAGFVDVNGDPSIASLDGPPVQQDEGTHALLNRGQTFAVEPRGDQGQDPAEAAMAQEDPQGQAQAPTTDEAQLGNPANVEMAAEPSQMTPSPQTGMVGLHKGIETTRVEPT